MASIPLSILAIDFNTLTVLLTNFNNTKALLETAKILSQLKFDNNTKNIIDLKAIDYTFNLPAGVYDGRFELVFNSVTGIEDESLPDNAIILSQQHGVFTLQSILDNEQIKDLNVYDINGRILFAKTDLNSRKTQVNLSYLPNGSIVLFKIMTIGQKTAVKKTIKLK